jgi:hypothetical protein
MYMESQCPNFKIKLITTLDFLSHRTYEFAIYDSYLNTAVGEPSF